MTEPEVLVERLDGLIRRRIVYDPARFEYRRERLIAGEWHAVASHTAEAWATLPASYQREFLRIE